MRFDYFFEMYKDSMYNEKKSNNNTNDLCCYTMNDIKNPDAIKYFIKKYREIIQSEKSFVDKYLDLVSPTEKYDN